MFPFLLVLGILLSLSSCVELVEPWEEDPYTFEVLPGQETVWQGSQIWQGWEIRFPVGAVQEAQRFSVTDVSWFQSPLTAPGYEYALVASAITILPADYTFSESPRLVFERPAGIAGRVRGLVSVDAAHMAEGFWDFADVETATSELSVVLTGTGTVWPVQLDPGRPAVLDRDFPVACFAPEEITAAAPMEFPEVEGECVRDTDCVVSGCQNEICSTGYEESSCGPPVQVCAYCGCLGQVCRWVQ